MKLKERYYNIHGIIFLLKTNIKKALHYFDFRFDYFRERENIKKRDIFLSIVSKNQTEIEQVCFEGQINIKKTGETPFYSYNDQNIFLEVIKEKKNRAFIKTDFRQKSCQAVISNTLQQPLTRMVIFKTLFHLYQLIQYYSLYPLHAACVSQKGNLNKAVLLTGCGGSGKSTLTAIMVQQGEKLLADDSVFLQPGKEIIARQYPRYLSLDAQILKKSFPELIPAVIKRYDGIFGKKQIKLDKIFPDCYASKMKPVKLVFLREKKSNQAAINILKQEEALIKLLQYNYRYQQGNRKKQYFQLVSQLTRQSTAYQLVVSKKVEKTYHMLKQLLEE